MSTNGHEWKRGWWLLALITALTAVGQEKGWKQTETIAAEEAHQGAAADERFVYAIGVPKEGKVLELVGKEKCPFSGQGIANDPVSGGLVGIVRGKKRVVVAVEGK